MALEKNIVNKLNRNESRRTRASGILPFEKGDVLDDLVFIECKSRSGREVKKGADKSFTILKSWIEKASKEALAADKPLIIPFQFASDAGDPDKIYAIMDVNDIINLIKLVKHLKDRSSDKK